MAKCNRCGAEVVWADHHEKGTHLLFNSPPEHQLWALETVPCDENDWGTKRIAKPISLYVIHMDTCEAKQDDSEFGPGKDGGVL